MRNFTMFLMIAGFCFAFAIMFKGNNFQSAFSRSRYVKRNTVTNSNSMPNQETSARVLSSTAHASTSETAVASHGSNQTTRFNTSEMVILYVFFGILFCAFVKEMEKKIGIPYAATIIVVSI